MNTSTEIAIFSCAFLQLALSAIILLISSDLKKNRIKDVVHKGGFDQTAFRANCMKFLLTSREVEILRLVGEGLPYKLIASQLNISEHTVNTHIKNMFAKVGVTNKMELVGRVAGN